MVKIAPYWKTVMSAVVTVAIGLQAAITDGHVTNQEWLTIGLAVLGTLGVYAKRNVQTY